MKNLTPYAFCFTILLAVAALIAGCQSYQVVQQNVFSDEDGNLVQVDYGKSESEHANSFISPATGKEMEFKSKLVVSIGFDEKVTDFVAHNGNGAVLYRVERANESFKAWQCMNLISRTGTTYKTDSDEWMVLINGFSCVIYHQLDEDPTQYLEVYRGVLCDSPKVEVEKDERWKVIKK